jgi:hypothetical protein
VWERVCDSARAENGTVMGVYYESMKRKLI